MVVDGLFQSFAVLLAIAGFALGAWALLADRARGRRRCPACWYDRSGTGTLTCSECGFVAAQSGCLARTRRRWRWAIVAGLVVSAAWFMSVWPRVRDDGWVSAVPAVVLIAGIPWSDSPDGTIWNELWSRHSSGDLSGWQRSLLARRLASILHDDNPWNRKLAAGWLGGLGASASCAVPGLIEIAGSEMSVLRQMAAGALGRILADGERCIPVLVGLLRDADPNVRTMATWSLWQFAIQTDADTSAAIPLLRQALTDPDPSRRLFTAQALSLILPDPQSVIPVFVEMLEHDEPYHPYRCLFALAEIADRSPDAVMLLVGALGESDRLIRESALHLIYDYGIGRDVPIPDSGRSRLHALAQSDDPRVRRWAARMLALPRRSR